MSQDIYLRRYYQVSLIFAILSLLESLTYFFDRIGTLNIVFLVFELFWLFISIMMIAYVVMQEYSKKVLLFPCVYLLYGLSVFLYSYPSFQGLNPLDKDVFIRNNAYILLFFAAVELGSFCYVWFRFLRQRDWTPK